MPKRQIICNVKFESVSPISSAFYFAVGCLADRFPSPANVVFIEIGNKNSMASVRGCALSTG